MISKNNLVKACISATLLCVPVWALDFSLVPIMPGTITNVQLSHYDIEGSGKGAPMFKLAIDNSGDTAHSGIIVVYSIEVASSALSGGLQTVYKGATDPFVVEANRRYEVLSNDFLNENSANPIHQKNRIEKLSNKALEQKVLDAGRVPTGLLRVSLYLAKGVARDHQRISKIELVEAEIVNVNQLDLITPGNSIENLNDGVVEINTPNPRFSWVSDLRADMYSDCDRCTDKNVFEISIFERKPGQSKNEVLASLPILKSKTTVAYLDYPSFGKQLTPGTTYLWRVTGLLKGIIDASFVSEPFAFKYAQMKNPDVESKIRGVSSILSCSEFGGVWESLKGDYGADVSVKLGGVALTSEQIKELENKFLNGTYTTVNVRVE